MKVLVAGAGWHDNLIQIIEIGFEEAGHEPRVFSDLTNQYLDKTWLKKYSHRQMVSNFFKTIREFKPDLVFVSAGLRFPGWVIKEAREKAKIPVANWVVDNPAVYHSTLFHDLSFYSQVFCIDRVWMPALEFMNPGKVFYLSHAADHLSFRPLNGERDIDLVYAGNVGFKLPSAPAGYMRAGILDFLAQQGFKLKAFLPGLTAETLKVYTNLKKIDYYSGYQSHDQVNRLYNQAKIVLSLSGPHTFASLSPRTFDAAYSGSFQLVEYRSDILEHFPGHCLPAFKNQSELLELVSYYLNHRQERERLSAIARSIALEKHTFKSRAKYICDIIKS